MENKEFKGLKIISANVHKLNILEELAKTSRINAQSVMTNNETIQSIVNELNRTDTHVNITNSTFKSNNSTEPFISIKTDSFPNNEELIASEYSEDEPYYPEECEVEEDVETDGDSEDGIDEVAEE